MAAAPRPYGRGSFGLGAYGAEATVAVPRPYGMGPYGVGPYGVSSRIVHLAGAAASVTLQSMAEPIAIYAVLAQTGVTFSIKGRPVLAITAAAATQISFSVQGELVATWQDAGSCFEPCEPGTWSQEYPPWTERLAA